MLQPQVQGLDFASKAKAIAEMWNHLGDEERGVWEEIARQDKDRELDENNEWQTYVEEWMESLPEPVKEVPVGAKRAVRTDELLAERKEAARAAKKQRQEADKEKKHVLAEQRKNGLVNPKMSLQQQMNRKMRTAFEDSVRRRASFYSEVRLLPLIWKISLCAPVICASLSL